MSAIQTFLSEYPKEALLPEDYGAAIEMLKGRDAEDALQLAVALRTGCTAIVTLDQRFASLYSDVMRFEVVT